MKTPTSLVVMNKAQRLLMQTTFEYIPRGGVGLTIDSSCQYRIIAWNARIHNWHTSEGREMQVRIHMLYSHWPQVSSEHYFHILLLHNHHTLVSSASKDFSEAFMVGQDSESQPRCFLSLFGINQSLSRGASGSHVCVIIKPPNTESGFVKSYCLCLCVRGGVWCISWWESWSQK